jgi:hypothetical protein
MYIITLILTLQVGANALEPTDSPAIVAISIRS